jgi:D-beta-D-heptose 7-phosphate kinase/D-beta-D-heptose 1-phosphate adenosyltransferase
MTADRRALVVGDIMLDRVIEGEVKRLAPEAPVPVLRQRLDELYPGGAANVAHNLALLGVRCDLVGPVGTDAAGAEDGASVAVQSILHPLRRCPRWLAGRGHHLVHYAGLLMTDYHTPIKTRLTSGGRVLFRYDQESERVPAEPPYVDWLARHGLQNVGAIALVDYGKGAVTDLALTDWLESARRANVPVLLDAKPTSVLHWRHALLVKMNEPDFRAACAALGVHTTQLDVSARNVAELTGLQRLVVTLGKRGLYYYEAASGFSVLHPGLELSEVDVAGAGDVVTAVLTAAVLACYQLPLLASVANVAAGLAVAEPGTCLTSPFEVNRYRGRQSPAFKVLTRKEEMEDWGRYAYEAGKGLVFTNGCFDLFHAGHLHFLEECRKLGDALVVSVNEDDSVRALKGDGRPVIPFMERCAILQALPCVDAVTCHADEKHLLENVKALRPSVLAKGEEWRSKAVVGADFVAQHGGRVAFVGRYNADTCSTSAIAERVRAVKVNG